MNDCWQNIIVGMKVEVENRDTDHSGVFSNSFWVASVLRISGYYAHLRYEGTHTFFYLNSYLFIKLPFRIENSMWK